MTKTKKLNNLFNKWRKIKEYQGYAFINDGIIDEQEWNKTNPKLLFIFKELVGDKKGEDWDLRELFFIGSKGENNENYYRTSKMLAMWAKGITEGFISYKLILKQYKDFHFNPEFRSRYLRKISVMNIKKMPDAAGTEQGSLFSWVRNTKEFIYKEIEIISPNIIIICGPREEINKIVFKHNNENFNMTANGIYYYKHLKGWLIINYYHPQWQGIPHSFLYTMLIVVVKNINI